MADDTPSTWCIAMDSTLAEATPVAPPDAFLISTADHARQCLKVCPHSQSLTGYDPYKQLLILICLPCNQWSCRMCAEAKIRRLAYQTRQAKPNRLLTLTCDPKLYTSRREAFDKTRRQLPELIRKLRDRFGEIEYLRVTELTSKGWPHYHLLIRSDFIPHAVVKETWAALTGAVIVDLRQVKESFSAYTYLVKYLAKLHKIEWTERHVSYSKAFFPKEEDDRPKLSLEQIQVLEMHPASFLQEYQAGCTAKRVSGKVWEIHPPEQPQDGGHDVDGPDSSP